MKIAYISADADVPVFGTRGCSVHVQEVIRAMLGARHSVDLFAASYGGTVSAEFSGLRMPSIAPPSAVTPSERERAALSVNKVLQELLSARQREIPFSMCYERYSLWSYAAIEFAREQGIPAILEVNAPLLDEHSQHHLLIHRAAAEDAAMRAFRAATAIVVVSQQLAHLVEQHPSARGKVHVVPNAVDPLRFLARSSRRGKTGDFVIGFAGELAPWQGLTNLIAAFALVVDALPHARLVIAGEGPEREPLEREIAARSLQQYVRLVGAVPACQIPDFLASLDVAVAPYPQLNGFYASPLKVFEYMAAGLPIVASRIGQVAEFLIHEQTGMLVAPGNKEELAETLYYLEQDSAKRARLGAAARSEAIALHRWDTTLAKILDLAGAESCAAC